MNALNVAVIVVYLVTVAWIGLRLSGRQRSSSDYFVGEGRMPWCARSWRACLSRCTSAADS